MITSLKENEIFVFGSNEAGRHGKGAAKQALKWGARYGIGFGLQGQTFAIPTKDKNLKVLPLEAIKQYVLSFIDFAEKCYNVPVAATQLQFLVTEIGCGLAGHTPQQIGPLFSHLIIRNIHNVFIPRSFAFAIRDWYNKNPKEFIEDASYYWASKIDNMIIKDLETAAPPIKWEDEEHYGTVDELRKEFRERLYGKEAK
jgi:hypothetical protein